MGTMLFLVLSFENIFFLNNTTNITLGLARLRVLSAVLMHTISLDETRTSNV